jgi:hypothetical protein
MRRSRKPFQGFIPLTRVRIPPPPFRARFGAFAAEKDGALSAPWPGPETAGDRLNPPVGKPDWRATGAHLRVLVEALDPARGAPQTRPSQRFSRPLKFGSLQRQKRRVRAIMRASQEWLRGQSWLLDGTVGMMRRYPAFSLPASSAAAAGTVTSGDPVARMSRSPWNLVTASKVDYLM